eukprot:3812906-Alexandrium_andersonii.AAC.1
MHQAAAITIAAQYLRELILSCPPRAQSQTAPLPCARARCVCVCALSGTTGPRARLATLIT